MGGGVGAEQFDRRIIQTYDSPNLLHWSFKDHYSGMVLFIIARQFIYSIMFCKYLAKDVIKQVLVFCGIRITAEEGRNSA